MTDQAVQWQAPVSKIEKQLVRLVYAQAKKWGWRTHVLEAFGIDIGTGCEIGPGLVLRHATRGVTIHPWTRIGSNVTIYHGVTIGRADVWRGHGKEWAGFVIEDDVVLCANAMVTSPGTSTEPLTVARGSVVGGNSVLTKSTQPWEIWAGIPAKKIGEREPLPTPVTR